jgi:hypothetical protein
MARTYKEQWEAIGDVNGRRSMTCMGSQRNNEGYDGESGG